MTSKHGNAAEIAWFTQVGDDVYLPKKGTNGFEGQPACIYFYYIGEHPATNPCVREYYQTYGRFELRSREKVEDAVKDLTRNARQPKIEQVPPPCGADWYYRVWTRKSYICIVIDDPCYEFQRPGVVFDGRDNAKPNHTFYDAWNNRLNIPKADGARRECPVVCFINHMQSEYGGDLQQETERFHFDLLTEPPLPEIPLADGRMARPLYPDSGGTNMGPPLGPP
jgi:hypothetical protein